MCFLFLFGRQKQKNPKNPEKLIYLAQLIVTHERRTKLYLFF